ncbi:DUF3817 domain-containing protein [Pseudomonas sp. Marseille-QA0892]
MPDFTSADARQQTYGRLRTAAWLEGMTLLILLFIAVPLKHLAGMPGVVSAMGPVHGVAFLFYLWQLASAARQGRWPMSRLVGFFVCAFIPFGFVLSLRALGRIER